MFLAPVLYPRARGADRAGDGGDERAARAAGLQLLGRAVRLCDEFQQGDAAAAAAAGGGRPISPSITACSACIVRFKLKTPGREPQEGGEAAGPVTPDAAHRGADHGAGRRGQPRDDRRLHDAAAAGGEGLKAADEAALKRLGARGVVRPSATALQVVLGPEADRVAGELRSRLERVPRAAAEAPVPARSASAAAMAAATTSKPPLSPAEVLAALGGAGNVSELMPCSSRLRAKVRDASIVDAGPADGARRPRDRPAAAGQHPSDRRSACGHLGRSDRSDALIPSHLIHKCYCQAETSCFSRRFLREQVYGA